MYTESRSTLVFAFVLVAGAMSLARASAQGIPDKEPYARLDHVQGTLVLTAAAPVRPMLIDSAYEVWAVNTDLSTVEHFGPINQAPLVTAPLDIRHVPWGPVSIAEWADPSGPPELLVVCRNTWGVLRMDKASGAYEEWIPLPAEPSDIVVDAANNRAFVSCTAADAVVKIDLTVRNGTFQKRYDEASTSGALQIKSPYFLSLTSDGKVRVAPLHSGNNTTVTGTQFQSVDQVISVAGRSFALPDKDLFEINPVTDAVTTIATGVGTILFAHGKNPVSNRYWVLNTDALNTNAAGHGEPDLHFDFVDNRVTIVGTPHAFVGVDPDSPGFTDLTSIGQPFALAFEPTTGRALVAGLLTDNVTLFDATASRLNATSLAAGSIPRGVALAPSDPRYVAVYCWGTARIEAF